LPPPPEMVEEFRSTLLRELGTWTKRFARETAVFAELSPGGSPWRFLGLSQSAYPQSGAAPLEGFVDIADESAASEIILRDRDALWIGRLDQARYWTKSQARLLARRLIWEQVNFLSGNKERAIS
jgi:hypothetical protein